MAWTLHNIKALSQHMNNEDSFLWITSTITQTEFDLATCDTKDAFLEQWHDIDAQNRIYVDPIYNKSLYRVDRREDSLDSAPSASDPKLQPDAEPEQKSVDNEESNESVDDSKMDIVCVVKTYDIRSKTDHEINSISECYELMKRTNLLQCYGLYHDPLRQQLLLTMEPLQMTLTQFVSTYRQNKGWDISEMQCKLIMSYLLYDLWTLHKTGYIHCDINPSNIMLRDRKSTPTLNGWRLIDYDNRLFVGEQTAVKTKGVRGCIEWTPPESVHCKSWTKKVRHSDNTYCYGTDIWSLGLVILFVLFGGQQPYSLTAEEQKKYEANLVKYWYKSKLLRNGGYNMDSTKNEGEIWLRNHLISLYAQKKISRDLFDLLHDLVLVFDPRKRGNAKTVWNHKWFDDYRHLCETMGQ